jgi:MarR family transcriptional regulator, organic hydroperoxide resistance regulator
MSDVRYADLRLDAQLCFPLYATTRAVTRVYADLLADLGLTYPQYLVMLVLWESPEPRSVGGLGERLRLDSGTLTPLLKRLESAGLVERRRDPDDERRVLVSTTDAGLALRDRAAGVPRRLGETTGLSRADAQELRDRLNDLLAHLEGAADTEPPGE